jgi:hypothetical protein
MPTATYEGNFIFKGLGNCEGVCGLKIFPQANGIFILVLTELDENTGASITNCYDNISTQVHQQFLSDIPVDKIIWLEHYDDNSYYDKKNNKETFDQVNLTYDKKLKCFSSPEWKHLGTNWITELKHIGYIRADNNFG